MGLSAFLRQDGYDRPSALHNIYDRITVNTRGLSSLGIDLRHYGSL